MVPGSCWRHTLHLAHAQCCHSLSPGQILSWAHFQSHHHLDSCVNVPYCLQFSKHVAFRNEHTTPGFPGGTSGKEPTCQGRRCKKPQFNLWVRKIAWRRSWQPTPVFLPGASHGQRSLMGYGPKGHTEFNIIKRLSTHALQVWLTSTE